MFQNKKCYLLLSFVLLFIVGTFVPTFKDTAFAEEIIPKPAIKTVLMKREPAGISPNPLKVKVGTTIVWFNHDPEPITIKFTTKLGIACKAPVNFYADLFGYYETGKIPQGGTASICFIFKGNYEYEVKRIVSKGKEKPLEEISDGLIIAEE